MRDHEMMCEFMPQEARERQISKLLQTAEELQAAALGPNPSINALRIIYGMQEREEILQIKRRKHHLIEACTLKIADATFSLEFDESNFNLGVYLRKLCAAEVPCDIKVALLHPKVTLLAREFVFSRETTNRSTPSKAKGFHAMTSHTFDDYCTHGCFFVALGGAVVQQRERAQSS